MPICMPVNMSVYIGLHTGVLGGEEEEGRGVLPPPWKVLFCMTITLLHDYQNLNGT